MEQAFTPHVVELVTGDNEDKTKSWEERKQAWLFRETTAALAPLAGLPMYEELKALTEEIFPAQQM